MSWSSSFFRYSKATLFFIARFSSVISLGNALALLADPDEQHDTMLALSFAMPVALLAVITSQYNSYHQKEVDAWYKHAVIAIQASVMGLIREAGAYTAIRFLLTLPVDDNLWYTWIKFFLAFVAGSAAAGVSLYETNKKPSDLPNFADDMSMPDILGCNSVTLETQLTRQFKSLKAAIKDSAVSIKPDTRQQLLDSYRKLLSEIHSQSEIENISINTDRLCNSINYA